MDDLGEWSGVEVVELVAALAPGVDEAGGFEDAGLVRTRREGRYKFHDLDTSPLKAISERWRIEP